MKANFAILFFSIIMSASAGFCNNSPKLVAFAISEPEFRSEITQKLIEFEVCKWNNEKSRKEAIQIIDLTIGHSYWGWTCSPEASNPLKYRENEADWLRPSRSDNFESALEIWRSEKNYLFGWSSDQAAYHLPKDAYPFYESTIKIISKYYKFSENFGIGYFGEEGRYLEFLPPQNVPEHTVNTAQYRCNGMAGFCIPGFFVNGGTLFPTAFRN